MDFTELFKLPNIANQRNGFIKLENQVTLRLGFNYEFTEIPNGKLVIHTNE